MIIDSFDGRIIPKKMGILNQDLAYALIFFTISSVLAASTYQDITLLFIFSNLMVGSLWRCQYVWKHRKDWFLRLAKSASKNESKAYVMIRSEL